MEILKIISLAFVTLILYLALKESKRDIASLSLVIAGIVILIFLVPRIKAIVIFLESIAVKTGVDIVYLNTIFKIIGIAYLTTFCSELCKDSDAKSLGAKVEIAGKVIILSLGIPILMAVLKSIITIVNV